jgi:hypothetical protein
MSVKIGSMFRWRSDALGIAAGTTGVCYAHADDNLHCVLFESGIPAALSDVELNRYALALGESPALAGYQFDGLVQLLDDYQRGLFASAFRVVPPSSAAA